MSDPETTETEAAAVARIAREHFKPVQLTVKHGDVEAPVLLTPTAAGIRAVEVKPILDQFRPRPERKAGRSALDDLDSFVALVNRHKLPDSTLWLRADDTPAGITAIFDDHAPNDGPAAFGAHRAQYRFPFDPAWLAWHQHDGKGMAQGAFAAFLEDRLADVLPVPVAGEPADADLLELGRLLGATYGGPDKLLDLSRGLQVHVGGLVANAVTMQSGEMQLSYEEKHQDASGKKLKVPQLFVIGVPVFKLGARYRLVARLRYRLVDGKIVWSYHLYRADEVREDAIAEAAAKAQGETGLPLFRGAPPTTRGID